MDHPVGARRLLFTAQASSRQLALDELAGNLPGSALEGWLSDGVGALYIPRDWDTIARRIKASPPVFCRHVCPASYSCDVSRDHSDIDRLVDAAQPLLTRIDASRTLSVQTRLLAEGDWPYGRYDVNKALASACETTGVTLDVRQPEQIVSVAIAAETAYLGLSLAADNLSNWAGGEQRFRREREQISRAEFKLLEALSVFDISLPQGGLALDLGAAPGGWTRVALQRGMRIVAVDPALLHGSLAGHQRLEHFPGTSQTFLAQDKRQFDVILNDMRMDAQPSTELMLRACQRLAPGGIGIMTLKLPQTRQAHIAQRALAEIGQRFALIGARQLFHNRSEVTIALRRG